MTYNIKENGFYQKISELDIHVYDGLSVSLFDKISGNYKKQINIDGNSNLSARFLLVDITNFELNICFNGTGTTGDIKIFAFSKDNIEIRGTVNVIVGGEENSVNVEIISLIGNDGLIGVDGNIDIKNGTKSNLGNLSQNSVYLSNNGRTIFTPKLAINTNNVKASHGGKIERLDPNKLFYFGSKGISDESSRKLMIDGYINSFVGDLEQLSYLRQDLSNQII